VADPVKVQLERNADAVLIFAAVVLAAFQFVAVKLTAQLVRNSYNWCTFFATYPWAESIQMGICDEQYGDYELLLPDDFLAEIAFS
jgi:hypothetical protein